MSFDCVTCGACCVSPQDYETYVDVELDEEALIPARMLLRRARNFSSLRTKRTKDGFVVCVALTGKPGKRVKCSIYDVRPGVCHEFKPGGPACLVAREELGLSS